MRDIIVDMVFGSYLYGLDTPESDKDYKGIFMPELDDLLLQRVSKSINTCGAFSARQRRLGYGAVVGCVFVKTNSGHNRENKLEIEDY